MIQCVINQSSQNQIIKYNDSHIVIVGDLYGKSGPPLIIDASDSPIIVTGDIQCNKLIVKGLHPVIVCGCISVISDIDIEPPIEIVKSCQSAFGNVSCISSIRVGNTLSCYRLQAINNVVVNNLFVDTDVLYKNLLILGKKRIGGNLLQVDA